jgi:hypothetical protein
MHRDLRGDAGSLHLCTSSQTSFGGLESFDEIHHGFAFVENRPTFYPPRSSIHRHDSLRRDSILSIASVSSYGFVINPGVKGPFEYGYQNQPVCCDMSALVTMATSFTGVRLIASMLTMTRPASTRAPGISRIFRPF